MFIDYFNRYTGTMERNGEPGPNINRGMNKSQKNPNVHFVILLSSNVCREVDFGRSLALRTTFMRGVTGSTSSAYAFATNQVKSHSGGHLPLTVRMLKLVHCFHDRLNI